MSTSEKFTWNEGDFTVTAPEDVSKSKLHVIHYSDNNDLSQSVRDHIPDAVAQTLFRTALNHALADGKSEMHAYIKAYKALQDAGYVQGNDKKWDVKKNSPTSQQVHVNRPLGSDEEKREEDKFDDPGTQDVDPPDVVYYADDIENPASHKDKKKIRKALRDIVTGEPASINVNKFLSLLERNNLGGVVKRATDVLLTSGSLTAEDFTGLSKTIKAELDEEEKDDDPGTQDVDPPFQHYPMTPNYLSSGPGKTAVTGSGIGKIEKRISGSSDISLNPKGVELANKLGTAIAAKGCLDIIHGSDLPRGVETVDAICKACPHTKRVKSTAKLRPWNLGIYEGKKGKEVGDQIVYFIEHPDDRPPGNGANGEQAETFNEAKVRQLSFFRQVYEDWHADPTLKIGIQTHGRGQELLQAWVDQDCPDDYDIKVKDLIHPDDPPHASMLRWHKDKIKEVDLEDDDPFKPGVYLILHSLTDDDTDEGNPELEDTKKGGEGSGIKGHTTGNGSGTKLSRLDHLDHGWISADGKFYPAGNLGHSHAAERDGLVERPGKYTPASNQDVFEQGHTRVWISDGGRSYLEGRAEDKNILENMRNAVDLMPPHWTGIDFVGRTGGISESHDFDNPRDAKVWLSGQLRKRDDFQKYLPPLEVHQAAKSAYDLGTTVLDITCPLADQSGLTEPGIRLIAKHFEASESATEGELAKNAWGGKDAAKWVQRVLKKIDKDFNDRWPAHILVDLDGTIAKNIESAKFDPLAIGEPIEPMCNKVRKAIADGKSVRIFTARMAHDPDGKIRKAVEQWCLKNLGKVLPVTNEKDPGMTELWDDKAHHPDEINKAGSGVIVCFMLDKDTSDKLALFDGERPEDMHVTLLHLGKLNTIPMNQLSQLESVLEKFGNSYAPVTGEIAGPIRFPACDNTDNKDVAVASFENPQIQNFRQALLRAVEDAGFKVSKDFSYTPHVTLKYLTPDDPMPVQRIAPIPVSFNKLTLCIGGAKKEYELTGVNKATGSKEGSWITINGQHVLVGADGKPLAGNPKAFGRNVSSKVETARKNAVLTGKHEQDIADHVEQKVSKALGIPRTKNNSAFDLKSDDVGIELKTMTTGKNSKVTMGKEALGRKLAEAQAEGIKTYTVVADMRGRQSAKYYVSEKLGSLRLGSMTPVSLSQLKNMVRQ